MAQAQEEVTPIEQLRSQVSRILEKLDPQTPIAATVVFPVDPAKEATFLKNSDALAAATRKLPGCNIYAYHEFMFKPFDGSPSGAVQYVVYEDWETSAQFRAQWDSDHLKRFQDSILDLLVGMPDLQFYYGWSRADATSGLPVPKTGQKHCFDDAGRPIPPISTGQDGEIQAGERWPNPRFKDNGDGTVTDRLTNLTWLRNADRFEEVTWEQALSRARGLAADGEELKDGSRPGDWRLPTIKELFSLIDYSAADPIIPKPNPFKNVRSSIYWTSTTLASAPNLAWMMTLGIGPTVFDLKVNANRMWPVKRGGPARVPKTGQKMAWNARGEMISTAGSNQDGETQPGAPWPEPRFADNGNGTVTDLMTGLVWLKNANLFGLRTWEQALRDCRELASGRGGLSDGSKAGAWRLPNIKEIESLVDYGVFGPCLPDQARALDPMGQPKHDPDGKPYRPVFDNVRPSSYWTSTSVEAAPSQAMFIILGVGPAIFENKEHPFFVWPVRDRAGC